MKKLLLVLVVFAGLGSTAMAQSNVAHVDLQVLWDTLPSVEAAFVKYSEIEKKEFEQLQEHQVEFEKRAQIFTEGEKDMIPAVREHERNELIAMQQRLEASQQVAREYLAKVSADLNAPLESRIKAAIKEVAKTKKLSYVIDASTLLYTEGGKDITNDVVVILLRMDKEATAGTGNPQ